MSSVNIIYDTHICLEAESLGKDNEIIVLDILEKNSLKKENVRNFLVERIKIYTKQLPKNPLFWAIKYAEYLLRICTKAISKKADVYHAHDLHCLIPAYIASKVNKAKVVYDSHELYTESGKSKILNLIWKFIERMLIKRISHIIAANESRAKIMRNEYGASKFPIAIMNCLPLKKVYPTTKLQEYLEKKGIRNKKIVLYQGGLFSNRCLEELVKSAKNINKNIVIIIMGYGELKNKLIKIAKDEEVKDKVFFHEAVPAKDLLSYTASADLGIVIYKNTCRNNYYCAPNKLFEYAMAGIPVAGCNFPEVAKILNKYKIGELFNPENPESIAKTINCILEDRDRYNRMKMNLKLANRKYNWEIEKIKLLRLYAELARYER